MLDSSECGDMSIDFVLGSEFTTASNTLIDELRERIIAVTERICALAEAANILAEAAAPFQLLSGGAGDDEPGVGPHGVNAFEQAARRLEAIRIEAVNEFTTLRARLSSEFHASH
jgi:hypothetical protein